MSKIARCHSQFGPLRYTQLWKQGSVNGRSETQQSQTTLAKADKYEIKISNQTGGLKWQCIANFHLF